MLNRTLFGFLAILAARAQTFSSGSTGVDGALSLLTAGTVVFNSGSFKPRLNSKGDGLYQFTSIYIGPGVTVKLSAHALGGPVFWLSQGPVQIDGTIDLDGSDGEVKRPSTAGAGGYPGGAPQKQGYRPDEFRPNPFLVPLVGGFGGDGGKTQGGGAGGGALLLASSASITINGTITANGGSSADGTGGGGGAIRLVAPVIDGTGTLAARGGQPGGEDGRIRFETFDNRFSGTLDDTPFAVGKPFGLFLPPNTPPSVRVISVDGRSVRGPEFSLAHSGRVPVVIEAKNIPPGTTVELEFFPETGPSQSVTTTALVGSYELSRAVVSVELPGGRSQGYAKIVWKHPAAKLQ